MKKKLFEKQKQSFEVSERFEKLFKRKYQFGKVFVILGLNNGKKWENEREVKRGEKKNNTFLND